MWLDDLVTVLTATGGWSYGTDLFYGAKAVPPLLASGFATTHLMATGGTAPDHTHNDLSTPAYEQPGAQVTFRAGKEDLAFAKAYAARNAYYPVRNQTINGTWYMWIKVLQEPFALGIDDRGQTRVAFNLLGKKKP